MYQAPEALPDRLEAKVRRDHVDEEDRKAEQDREEHRASWDHLEGGKQGIMGPPGQSGEKGEKGDVGPRGMPGLKGAPWESISSPNVVVNPPSLTVNETEAASLQCSAGGNPEPVMVWSKVGGLLPEGRSAVFSGKLEVQKSQMNDSGVYQCTATNILGVAQKQVKLVVNGQ